MTLVSLWAYLSLLLGLLSRLLPAEPCDPAAGLRLLAQADAQDSGYLMPAAGSGHFRHAVYDLVQGRARFFEIEVSPGRYYRYALADAHDPACIERRRFDAELAGLPMAAGRCVTETAVSVPLSRYAVSGYSAGRERIPRAVAVRDRDSGGLLAEYRWPRFAFISRHAACAAEALRTPGHPLWNITAFVFRDRWGSTLGAADFERIRIEQAQGAAAPELLPPPAWVERRLAEDGEPLQPPCHLPGWMGETEVHLVELERGPLEVDARLDNGSSKAGMAILDVHVPDKAVVILVRSEAATVWHVHESRRSSVVAMLVRGQHGQAVVGLSPYTRVLVSTQLHNPYSNCTQAELGRIEAQVTQRYGITRALGAADGSGPGGVRFAIGEPMPEGGELFHYDRTLPDFEVRDE
jgi:hypothetical protein